MENNILNTATIELLDFMPNFENKIAMPNAKIIKKNISPFQMRTMFILNIEGAKTMTEIANCIGIKKQQLTPLIDKLVLLGFVVRQHKTDDRRFIKLSLTKSARTFINKQNIKLTADMKLSLSKLSNNDLLLLYRSMKRVNKLLKKL
jgi:DNA-binding MarR family transcriptional regulator